MALDTLPPGVESLGQLTTAIVKGRITSYFDVAGTTLVFFDYLLSFASEVQYIWKQRWSSVTVLFLITRYLPFFDIPLTIMAHDLPLPLRQCTTLWHVQTWSYIFGLSVANVILSIRTLAIWDNGKKVLAGLIALALLCTVAAVVFARNIVSTGRSSKVVYNPLDAPVYPGCFLVANGNALLVCYVILLGYETAIFLLIVAKMAYHGDMRSSSLYKAVYRDGILYYACLLAASIVNIVLLVATPGISSIFLTGLHRALHAILAERLILNIRQSASIPSQTKFPLSSLRQLDQA